MGLATFNLPEEVKERLKLEDNQSELITNLLLEYFRDLSADKLMEQINLLEAQKELQKKTLEVKIEDLRKKVEEKQKAREFEIKKAKASEFIKKAQEEAITEI